MKQTISPLRSVLLATLLLTTTALTPFDLDARPGSPQAELNSDIAVGRRLSARLEQNSALLEDPVVGEYVNRIGQTLVRNSDAGIPFIVRVIDSDEINAFGFPGGFIFVTKGLILAADDEAELAGIMAHEIAHVLARHAASQPDSAWTVHTLPLPAIIVGNIPRNVLEQAAALSLPLAVIRFSENAESEADWLGAQYAYKSGYAAAAEVNFFEKLRLRENSSRLSPLFDTHRQSSERLQRTRMSIETALPPRRQNITSTEEFQAIRARLR